MARPPMARSCGHMARPPMARLCGRMVGPSRACSCVYDMLGPLMVCSRLPMVCLRTYSVLASAYGVFTCGVLAYDMFPSYELAIRSKPLLGGSGIGMRCWSPLRTTIAIQCHGWKSRTGNTFLPLCHEPLGGRFCARKSKSSAVFEIAACVRGVCGFGSGRGGRCAAPCAAARFCDIRMFWGQRCIWCLSIAARFRVVHLTMKCRSFGEDGTADEVALRVAARFCDALLCWRELLLVWRR